MPWGVTDAERHTKLAKTPKLRRQWRDVANSELRSHGDEARAIRTANAVLHRQTLGFKGPARGTQRKKR